MKWEWSMDNFFFSGKFVYFVTSIDWQAWGAHKSVVGPRSEMHGWKDMQVWRNVQLLLPPRLQLWQFSCPPRIGSKSSGSV